MEQYVIVSVNEHDDDGQPLYWNNQDGWVRLSQAEVFDSDTQHGMNGADFWCFDVPDRDLWAMLQEEWDKAIESSWRSRSGTGSCRG